MKTLAEAKVGQRLNFAYWGGSNPGKFRTVEVTKVGEDRIFGIDEEKEADRQYLFEKAGIIEVLSEPKPAAPKPEVGELVPMLPTHRIRSNTMSFPAARDLLHQQIEELSGEDLAEVLAEIQGEDKGTFDAKTGEVTVERAVAIPHVRVNMNGNSQAASIDWVDEEGNAITTTTYMDGQDKSITLLVGNDEVTAEEYITRIAKHFDLTIS